jgi:hypothetical protein
VNGDRPSSQPMKTSCGTATGNIERCAITSLPTTAVAKPSRIAALRLTKPAARLARNSATQLRVPLTKSTEHSKHWTKRARMSLGTGKYDELCCYVPEQSKGKSSRGSRRHGHRLAESLTWLRQWRSHVPNLFAHSLAPVRDLPGILGWGYGEYTANMVGCGRCTTWRATNLTWNDCA